MNAANSCKPVPIWSCYAPQQNATYNDRIARGERRRVRVVFNLRHVKLVVSNNNNLHLSSLRTTPV